MPHEGRVFCGLDLSLRSTGVCFVSSSGVVLDSFAVGYKLKRADPVREKVERLAYIGASIVSRLSAIDCRDVVMEGYAFRARGAQNDLGELHGVVKYLLWTKLKIEPVIVPVTTARRKVLGNGGLSKAKVKIILTNEGFVFKTDDEGDAYVVAEHLRLTSLGITGKLSGRLL